MRGIRPADRLLIAGQTGKGKTTLALWLGERMQPIRRIVFDPKDELAFPGVEPCRNVHDLPGRLAEPLVHYIPSGFDRDALEEACQIVWETPGPYLWHIDETAELSTPGYVPRGLGLCCTQGRGKEKMVLAVTQRLSEIHPVFRSQASHVFIFTPPPIMLDLKAVAGHVRREAFALERELRELHAEHGDYSHLWYVVDTDELRRCAPIPSDGTPGPPPGEPATATGDEDQDSEPWQAEEWASA